MTSTLTPLRCGAGVMLVGTPTGQILVHKATATRSPHFLDVNITHPPARQSESRHRERLPCYETIGWLAAASRYGGTAPPSRAEVLGRPKPAYPSELSPSDTLELGGTRELPGSSC